MISSVYIEGFKRFKSQHFAFESLTVLTGLNGSGKTTLIQALMITQEVASIRAKTLRLNGPFRMELGTAEDILNWDSRGPIRISYDISMNTKGETAEEPDVKRETFGFKCALGVPNEDAMYLSVDECSERLPLAFSGEPRAFTYLSAERLGPRSVAATSPLSEAELVVGEQGEYCAHVLSVLGDLVLEDSKRLHPNSDSSAARLLKYEVEQWLSEIARPIEINGERLAGSTVAELRFRIPGSTWVRSTNMGFGVTYALPIVLSGLIAVSDGLLVVENPEAHLHPAGQSRMGVFLAWLAGQGVQVVVETHSDHVLNGIRRGIAEYRYLTSSASVVHWFGGVEDDHDEPRVSELRIGENGTVSDWPRGFFDQYQIDVASLGQVRRKRR